MYNVVILVPAQQDIKDASFWYNSKQKGLGKRFASEIRKKVSQIKQYPEASAVRYDNVKTAVLDTFPYMIHYVADGSQQLIIILAVLHTSRNPELWTKDKNL